MGVRKNIFSFNIYLIMQKKVVGLLYNKRRRKKNMDSSSNYKILVHVVLFYDALTSRSLNPIIMGLFIYLFIKL